jgi:hypothetical protein
MARFPNVKYQNLKWNAASFVIIFVVLVPSLINSVDSAKHKKANKSLPPATLAETESGLELFEEDTTILPKPKSKSRSSSRRGSRDQDEESKSGKVNPIKV